MTAKAVDTAALFRGYATFVARLLSKLGVPPAEVEDAVQEVFLVVHRNGGCSPAPAAPKGCLASLALRCAAGHRRRDRKSQAQQSLEQLQGALNRLDPVLRTTLVLAEIEGESCKDIAASMRAPLGKVYWRLHRARKDLRTCLDEQQAREQARLAERAPAELRPALAAGAFLFGATPGHALLNLARKQPAPSFDAAAALNRFLEQLRSGPSLPPWAVGLPAGKVAGMGAAFFVPAILASVAAAAVGGNALSSHAAAGAPSATVLAARLVELPTRLAPAIPDPESACRGHRAAGARRARRRGRNRGHRERQPLARHRIPSAPSRSPAAPRRGTPRATCAKSSATSP